jgi:hypothetical protein
VFYLCSYRISGNFTTPTAVFTEFINRGSEDAPPKIKGKGLKGKMAILAIASTPYVKCGLLTEDPKWTETKLSVLCLGRPTGAAVRCHMTRRVSLTSSIMITAKISRRQVSRTPQRVYIACQSAEPPSRELKKVGDMGMHAVISGSVKW